MYTETGSFHLHAQHAVELDGERIEIGALMGECDDATPIDRCVGIHCVAQCRTTRRYLGRVVALPGGWWRAEQLTKCSHRAPFIAVDCDARSAWISAQTPIGAMYPADADSKRMLGPGFMRDEWNEEV